MDLWNTQASSVTLQNRFISLLSELSLTKASEPANRKHGNLLTETFILWFRD